MERVYDHPLAAATRLRVRPAATRRSADDLLVNVGGSSRPVHRLNSLGRELWASFSAGSSIAESAAGVAEREGISPEEAERIVSDFARNLVLAELAVPVL